MMKYKGYRGSASFDDEAEVFRGVVCGIKDVITYEGSSVEELKKAFQDSVNDYLDFCQERGEKPDKPYSGRFNLRISSDLHAKLDLEAKYHNKSLNTFVSETLERVVGE